MGLEFWGELDENRVGEGPFYVPRDLPNGRLPKAESCDAIERQKSGFDQRRDASQALLRKGATLFGCPVRLLRGLCPGLCQSGRDGLRRQLPAMCQADRDRHRDRRFRRSFFYRSLRRWSVKISPLALPGRCRWHSFSSSL